MAGFLKNPGILMTRPFGGSGVPGGGGGGGGFTAPATAAGALIGDNTYGFAYAVSDLSVYIKDENVPANDIDYSASLADFSSVFTYTSPSPKQFLHADGVNKYGAHNLFLNPSGTAIATQDVTVIVGRQYRVAVTGTVEITLSGAGTGTATAASPVIVTATTTTLTCTESVAAVAGDTVHVHTYPADQTFVDGGASPGFLIPVEYDAGASAVKILWEVERTNLSTYATQLDNAAFAKVQCSVTANAATAPNGQTHADKIVESVVNAQHYTYRTISATAAKHCFSVCLKAGERTRAQLYIALASDHGVNVNLSTGAIEATLIGAPDDYGIIDLGSGWYRVWIVKTCTAGNVFPVVHLATAVSASRTGYAGDGASGLYAWGYQFELGDYPTSLIETFSTTLTRAADQITKAASSTPLSATVNTIYCEYEPGSAAAAEYGMRIDDGTANERIDLGHDASGNAALTVTDGGAAQTAPLTSGTVTAGTLKKLSAKYKANDFILSNAGATAATDTSGTLPAVTTIHIGPTASGLIRPADLTSTEVEGISA